MLWIIPGIIISYSIGSIPTAYIFGRILKGIDIRNFGSGNVGATNALRVLGKKAGITVLFLDVLKGFIVTTFLGDFIFFKTGQANEEFIRLVLGFTCVAGHNWTVFLNFKGGKGIAASLGVLLGLSARIAGLKVILGLVILVWFLIFLSLRIVSIASVVAASSLPVFMFVFNQSNLLKVSTILLSIFVVLRHKSNLKRFLEGKEARLK